MDVPHDAARLRMLRLFLALQKEITAQCGAQGPALAAELSMLSLRCEEAASLSTIDAARRLAEAMGD